MKRNRNKFHKAARAGWELMLLMPVALPALAGTAAGATYNFYFNNTEQGPNSTAQPALTVNGGQSNASQGLPLPGAEPAEPAAPAVTEPPATQAAEAAPVPSAAPSSGSATTTVAYAEDYEDELEEMRMIKRRRWRLTLSGAAIAESGTVTDSYDGLSFNRVHGIPSAGFAASLGYRPSANFGLSAYVGRKQDSYGYEGNIKGNYYGFDVEVMPVHLSVWKLRELFELGFLAGVSSLAAAEGNWGSLHVGARANINFGGSFGLTGVVRVNEGFLMGEAGLTFWL